MKKDESLIPKGPYCYTYVGDMYKICPYWDSKKDLPEQANGYCHFLEKSDMDLAEETEFTDMKTGEKSKGMELPIGIGTGLLWDQCKECGINDEMEEE